MQNTSAFQYSIRGMLLIALRRCLHGILKDLTNKKKQLHSAFLLGAVSVILKRDTLPKEQKHLLNSPFLNKRLCVCAYLS